MNSKAKSMWCFCSHHAIEHKRVGMQTMCDMLFEVYECPECRTLKRELAVKNNLIETVQRNPAVAQAQKGWSLTRFFQVALG
jgi:Zn-finger protein